MNNLEKFIKKQTEVHEKLETAGSYAWWNLATTGDERYAKELQDSKTALRTHYSSKADYETLKSFNHSTDPTVLRQVEILKHSFQENQISKEKIEEIVKLETDIEEIYTNFRPVVKGEQLSNNDLKQILVKNTDSKERQEAWEASKKIGEEVESKVLELIKLRNEAAISAGFKDFYSMNLELQELNQDELFAVLKDLENVTQPYWDKYKRELDENLAKKFGINVNDLMPWHYQDPFFQEAPSQDLDLNPYYTNKNLEDISHRFYASIGLPAEDIIRRSDLYEREKKNQHAFCSCLDRKQDVRMLCNLRDNEYWMGTLLHELGHGVYDKYIDQTLPYFLRSYAHTSSTEAIAMLFGRLSRDGDFLHKYCGVAKQDAESIDLKAKKSTAATLLVFARWVLVMTHFEKDMYQKPGIDLNAHWWSLVEKFQSIRHVQGRSKPDWASKLHLACAPVYYQNYILGEMTASQLKHSILQKVPQKEYLHSSEVGKWLKEKLFSQGAKRPWNEALKYATGEYLNPTYFAQDLKVLT